MKLTRRDFIKTAGAATGTMAISSVIPMPAWAEGQNGGPHVGELCVWK